jgi:hypothetical protein
MCLARSHGPFSKPNVARVYDYLLGGKDKCAADREIPGRLLEMCLPLRDVTRENRAVTRVARQGIGQFADLGTGLPAQPNIGTLASRQAGI